LQVESAEPVRETETVFVVGFPLGVELGKNVSVRKSSVSSRRRDARGTLQQVQIEGGIDPGNSGGPVVDIRGNVIGVAVAKIVATQINFAVPGDSVKIILNGRPVTSGLREPYRSGKEIKVPILVDFLDPLNRVRKVTFECWTGDRGKPRPPTSTQPKPESGDGPIHTLVLDYKNGRATGELVLPPAVAGKVYWRRIAYENDLGKRWIVALPYTPAPPLERKPALLILKHQKGARGMKLNSTSTLQLVGSDGEQHKLVISMESHFLENTHTTTEDGKAGIRLQYARLRLGVNIDGKAPPRDPRVMRIVRDGTRLVANLVVDDKNKLLSNKADLRLVPLASREDVSDMHEQVQESLETIAIPMPGKVVQPGEKWRSLRPMVISTVGKPELAVVELTCTYLGSRVRNGREEAFISLTGIVKGRQGQELKVGGKANGFALLDLATGQISQASVTTGLDLDLSSSKGRVRANGTLAVQLVRGVAPPPKK
jgi:hypothetical protein